MDTDFCTGPRRAPSEQSTSNGGDIMGGTEKPHGISFGARLGFFCMLGFLLVMHYKHLTSIFTALLCTLPPSPGLFPCTEQITNSHTKLSQSSINQIRAFFFSHLRCPKPIKENSRALRKSFPSLAYRCRSETCGSRFCHGLAAVRNAQQKKREQRGQNTSNPCFKSQARVAKPDSSCSAFLERSNYKHISSLIILTYYKKKK